MEPGKIIIFLNNWWGMKLEDNYENAILQAKHRGGSILCGILLNALVYLEVGIKRNITHHKTTTSYGSLFLTFLQSFTIGKSKICS